MAQKISQHVQLHSSSTVIKAPWIIEARLMRSFQFKQLKIPATIDTKTPFMTFISPSLSLYPIPCIAFNVCLTIWWNRESEKRFSCEKESNGPKIRRTPTAASNNHEAWRRSERWKCLLDSRNYFLCGAYIIRYEMLFISNSKHFQTH